MTLLIFSFDGSGKDAETGIQEQEYGGRTADNNITNVVKLHLLCGGNLFPEGQNYGLSTQVNVHRAFYYPGIGAYGNILQQAVNMTFAPRNMDVAMVINKAKQDFIGSLPSDLSDLKVVITGYSRGAALARRFATILHRYFEGEENKPANEFIYLIAWDTVASIGMPDISTENRPDYDVVFEEGNTLSASVCQANHMVAIDEKRRSFQPTLMNYDPERVLEVWFIGAHGDIGGGYHYDGLSDIALDHTIKWLQRMHQEHGLPAIDLSPPTEKALDRACPGEIRKDINCDDLQVHPNPMGKSHQQDRMAIIAWATLYDRICCVVSDDKINASLTPLIHHSVPVRVYRDQRYNPVTLARMATAHRVWRDFDAEQPEYSSMLAHQQATRYHWQTLQPGESLSVRVEADRKFNYTGLMVNTGEQYEVTVAANQSWHDADILCGAEGWERGDISKGFAEILIAGTEPFRRVPDANWFYLCAAIGTDAQSYMKIGKHKEISITQTGELTFFANDLDSRYHNNWGYIDVTVTRL